MKRLSHAAAAVAILCVVFTFVAADERRTSAFGLPDLPMVNGVPAYAARSGAARGPMGRHGPYGPPPGMPGMGGPFGADGRPAPTMQGTGPVTEEEIASRRKSGGGEFSPEDLKSRMPRQEDMGFAPDEEPQHEPGERGWVKTGTFDKRGGGGGGAHPTGGSGGPRHTGAPDTTGKHTGRDGKPSRAQLAHAPKNTNNKKPRKDNDGSKPAKAEDAVRGSRKRDATVDKCQMAATDLCSTRMVQENLARFTECVWEHRDRIGSDCKAWAEQQGACAADMVSYCHKLPPLQTAECMKANQEKLSSACRESAMFGASAAHGAIPSDHDEGVEEETMADIAADMKKASLKDEL
jgi:hypothetical protein